MTNQEELLKTIKVLSESIKKKTHALKIGLIDRNRYLEDTFKPIVEPLNKIKDTITKPSNISQDDSVEYKSNINEHDTSGAESSERDTEYLSKSSDILYEDDDDDEEKSTDKQDEGNNSGDHTSESPTNISILSQEIGKKGPLSRKYILKMLHSGPKGSRYHVYGARLESDGLRMGDSKLIVDDNDNLTIKEQTFKGTSGLFELIFKHVPNKYTKSDLNTFKNICILTNSHRKSYSQATPIHRNRSEKYKTVIAKLFSKCRGKHRIAKGKGVSMKSVYDTNIIYYNDVNKLVDRMRLIHESIQAGHNGLENEMVALTEELKGRGYIA